MQHIVIVAGVRTLYLRNFSHKSKMMEFVKGRTCWLYGSISDEDYNFLLEKYGFSELLILANSVRLKAPKPQERNP